MNTTLRRFLIRILPPFIADAAVNIRRRRSDLTRGAEWEAVADTEEVWTAHAGWSHPSIVEIEARKWPQFLNSVEAPKAFATWREEILTFGYVLGRAAVNRKSLSVLDWGGGLGKHFVYARETQPEIELKYTIKDLSTLCAAGRELLPEVQFISDEDEALNCKYDLVVAASSLQYARKLYDFLDRLCASAGGWFLVLRTPIIMEQEDFVVVQRPYGHGYLTEYPCWFINRNKFISHVESNGFTLQREFPGPFGIFVPNAPEQCTVTGFLFKRTV